MLPPDYAYGPWDAAPPARLYHDHLQLAQAFF